VSGESCLAATKGHGEPAGGDPGDVVVAGRGRRRGRDQRAGILEEHVEEVLVNAGDLALRERVDGHAVQPPGQRLGSGGQGVMAGGAGDDETARPCIAVEFGLDGVEQVGDVLVLIDADRRGPGDKQRRVSGN
jgi:hypothetical protein